MTLRNLLGFVKKTVPDTGLALQDFPKTCLSVCFDDRTLQYNPSDPKAEIKAPILPAITLTLFIRS